MIAQQVSEIENLKATGAKGRMQKISDSHGTGYGLYACKCIQKTKHRTENN